MLLSEYNFLSVGRKHYLEPSQKEEYTKTVGNTCLIGKINIKDVHSFFDSIRKSFQIIK